jgi:hypothetical protein
MTHKGSSKTPASKVYGKNPSHNRARIRTISDCVCYENKIVEEWLMRDNSFLFQSLGINFRRIAIEHARKEYKQSQGSKNPQPHLVDRLGFEMERVEKNNIVSVPPSKLTKSHIPRPSSDPKAYAVLVMNVVWNKTKLPSQKQQSKPEPVTTIEDVYDSRIAAHLPGGREVYGHIELKEYCNKYLQRGLTNVSVSVDHVACIPYLPTTTTNTNTKTISDKKKNDDDHDNNDRNQAVDIAVRWTLVATHSGWNSLLGSPSKRRVYILASSHFRILRGHKIREEWTVWDEVALVRQAELQRLVDHTESGGSDTAVLIDRAIIVLAVVLAIFVKLRMDGFVLTEYLGTKI